MATATKKKNRIAESNGDELEGLIHQQQEVQISAPNMRQVIFTVIGTTPFVQNKFSNKAREAMKRKQQAGSQGKKGIKREPKDFQENYEQAQHRSHEGWRGIPANAFRAAMVDACRLVGFKMTVAKLAVFIEADGFDADDGTPLVKITKGEPRYVEHCVRNESGVSDIRARPMWDQGWEAIVRVNYDADMFTALDVANLLARVGTQLGVGEGRPNSKKSTGQGWGLFRVESA